MKAKPNCIACVMKQARMIMDNHNVIDDEQIKIYDEIFDILYNMNSDLTPGHYHSVVLDYLSNRIGVPDFYKIDKQMQNQTAVELLPTLKCILDESNDRLFTALLLSAAGNIIDLAFGANFDIKENVIRCLHKGFEVNSYKNFKHDLLEADNLLLITDNAGEIVFDKLLVEEIQRYVSYHEKKDLNVEVMVKGGPVLNDATMVDAAEIDFTNICNVSTTQSNYIGAPLELIGPNAKKSFNGANIIIAKGQGNYETLGDEKTLHGRLYILLQAKCQVIADSLYVDRMKTIFKKI